MNDALRLHRGIKDQLHQLYPEKPKGRLAQTLETLAWMIAGIVKSGQCQLPALADHAPYRRRESFVKRFSRFLRNERIDRRCEYAAFAKLLLRALAKRRKRLHLVIDGSAVGKGCRTLMISVLYQHRALPLTYLTEVGEKGHFSEAMHLELLERIRGIIPLEASIVFLGDGEFDGTTLMARLEAWGWEFVCRTARNARLTAEGETFAFHEIAPLKGETASVPDALFTEVGYGPVQAVAAHREDCREPIYLITNLELAEEAVRTYEWRFGIETLFSDQKSRGFHLHKSHLSDPDRLSRLMIAACLAYLWLVFLGQTAKTQGWIAVLHRKKRCDLSLFRLGCVFLRFLSVRSLDIPVDFLAPPIYPYETVRY
jgi:hypothetical protein